MKLNLGHVARLNLHSLLGQVPAKVGEIRLFWAIQEKLALTEKENKAVGYHEEVGPPPEKQRIARWNSDQTIEEVQIDLSDEEVDILSRVLDVAQFPSQGNRVWLEPLLVTLDEHEDRVKAERAAAAHPAKFKRRR